MITNEKITVNGKEYTGRKSKYTTNTTALHVSDDMSGKMKNIPSVSTSCLNNPICQKRMQDGESVCAHCFAAATLARYTACGAAAESNTVLLNDSVLPVSMLPKFKPGVKIARIESFGDVASETQAINYANMARNNPGVVFAWWTKNTPIVAKAFDAVGKPKNVILIESSPKVNTPVTPSSPYVDKVFTVYDDETIARDHVRINCGARSCDSCRRCYKKTTAKNIAERLK